MGQVEFLRALLETGRVRVDPPDRGILPADPFAPGVSAADEQEALSATLAEWHSASRLEFPGRAPDFLPEVALSAARAFYTACQFVVYRDVDAPTVAALFAQPLFGRPAAQSAAQSAGQSAATDARAHVLADAAPLTPAHHYSVDLIFRFLPDLFRLAYRTSQGDPLCDGLRQWAAAWPLSSIGMADVNPIDLSVVTNHAGLLRLYADRVIARRDVSRLADPRVRSAVAAALGYFGDANSPIAKALRAYDPPPLPAHEPSNLGTEAPSPVAAATADAPIPSPCSENDAASR